MFSQDTLIHEMDNLRKFAVRLTRNPHDAEDLLQSTLLRALEKKHLFQPDTNLFGWTSKMMFNLFVSDYRRKTKFESQYDPENYLAKQSVDAVQEIKSELLEVNEAMDSLSEDHRRILVLICVKGMSYEEVASSLGIPVGTVRSRLARARENLQIILDTPIKEDVTEKSIVPPYVQNMQRGSTQLASWC
jgi:RNA polymerase sigma-70 factor (ECF subfamily)